jgi:hypothetical protein
MRQCVKLPATCPPMPSIINYSLIIIQLDAIRCTLIIGSLTKSINENCVITLHALVGWVMFRPFSSYDDTTRQSNSAVTLSKGPNKLPRYKRVSLYAMGLVKVKEKYFEAKYRPVGILISLRYDKF